MNAAKITDLPVSERLKMMEALWTSLCAESVGEPPSPAWHREVLEERLARISGGTEQISSWQDAKQRIRNQLSGGR